MRLTKSHFERLADYFADISKGLFMGALATQAISGISQFDRIIRAVAQTVLSLLSLYISLLLTREKENER